MYYLYWTTKILNTDEPLSLAGPFIRLGTEQGGVGSAKLPRNHLQILLHQAVSFIFQDKVWNLREMVCLQHEQSLPVTVDKDLLITWCIFHCVVPMQIASVWLEAEAIEIWLFS